jgi:hypothetical protein
MIITQTIDIPADRRITVPKEVPMGKVILTFTTMTETDKFEFVYASTGDVTAADDEILNEHLDAFKALAK